MVTEAAEQSATLKITNGVRELAGSFNRFYSECRVIKEDDELTQDRLWLAEAVRIGLAEALELLGVSVPDEMARIGVEGGDDGP